MTAMETAFSDTMPDILSEGGLSFSPTVLPSSLEIEALLRGARTIAVVGLSPKPQRDSHDVAKYLQSVGYRVVPINPLVASTANPFILGERCYANLTDAAFKLGDTARIDIVNVFRRSEEAPTIVEEAVMVGAQAIWLQLGIKHASASQFALEMGLVMVQDRCIKIEHRRVFT